MAAFVLAWGTGRSPWTAYVAVGAVVLAIAGLLYLLAASMTGFGTFGTGVVPTLAVGLAVIGLTTLAAGFGLRRWRRGDPSEA